MNRLWHGVASVVALSLTVFAFAVWTARVGSVLTGVVNLFRTICFAHRTDQR